MATSEDDPVGYDAEPAAPVKDWTKSVAWKFVITTATLLGASTVLAFAAWWAVKVYNFLP